MFCFSDCSHRQICEEAKLLFSDLEFEMIMDRWEVNGNYFHLYGANIKKQTEKVEFHKGDIIVKKKGDKFIKIYHGEDHFKFNYVCENEIVKFNKERF